MSEKNVRVLNDLDLAGNLSFTQNLSGFPENPKPRTLVVKGGTPYLYTELVDGSGYFSWVPIGYRQGAYVHTQGVASTSWTVSHNFNTVNFGYFVYDSNHKLVIANANVIDANTIQIQLSEAITGTVVVFSTESIFAGVLSASTSVALGNITLRDANGILTVNNNAVAMQAALTAEAVARTAADVALGARIDAVIANTDSAALDSLTEVVAAFQSADGNLNAAISTLSSSASSAVAAEETRALAAEAALSTSINGLVGAQYTDARARSAISVTGNGSYNSTSGVITINSNAYTLPVATASQLGGVKQGANVTIAADGTISVAGAGIPSVVATTTTVGDGTAAARLTTQASAASSVLQIVSAVNSAGNGGTIQMFATQATAAAGAGGAILITGGSGGATNGAGGYVSIQAGNSYGSASGQTVTIQGGTHAGSGLGGDLNLTGGYSMSGTGGSIVMSTGVTGAQTERLRVTPTGALSFGGAASYGTSGQVLTSNGNAAPTWQTPTASAAAAGTLTGSTLSANVTASSLTSVGTLTSLTVSGAATVGGQPVGYLTVPQNAQGAYTLVLADSGKHIFTSAGGVTWTIPANASVAFPIGTAVTFVNQSASTCSIAITSDSMYLAGAGTLGTRTLAAYGMATAIKVSATSWMISGNLT